MAYNIPNGSRVYVASKYDDEIKITEATNAEEAVLTVDDVGGIAKCDIVHVPAVWEKASGDFRVASVAESKKP
ncbi:hypothetical protein ACEE86_04715 [Proteus mirabilis]